MLSAHLTSAQSRLGRLRGSLRTISQDFVFAALSQVLGRGSLILASILVANFMTVESFSTFTYFNLTLAMIATFSTLGLSVAASRIFAESTVSLDEEKRSEARCVLALAFGSAFVMVAVLHMAPDAWLLAGTGLSRPVFYASVLAITMNTVLMGAVSGRGDFRLLAVAGGAGLAVLLVAVAAAVQFASVGLALWGVLASMGLQIALYWSRLLPMLRGSASGSVSRALAGKVLSIAGPMFVTSLLIATVFWALGRSLLGAENGTAEFSKYAVGLQWFSFILLVPSITTRVFFPRIVRATVNDSAHRRHLVLANAGANFLVAAIIGMGALIFDEALLALYGNAGVTDPGVFRLFVLAAVSASPVNGLSNAIIACDPGPRRWLLLQVGWALIVLFSAQYVGLSEGASAPAIGFLTGYLALIPASVLVLWRMKLL
ncbi:MAG: hypothetical protein AAGF86_03865 [Pseudomonadota bacterium]